MGGLFGNTFNYSAVEKTVSRDLHHQSTVNCINE